MRVTRALVTTAAAMAALGAAAGSAQANDRHDDTVIGVNGPVVGGDVIDVEDSFKHFANDLTVGVDGPVYDAVKVLTHVH